MLFRPLTVAPRHSILSVSTAPGPSCVYGSPLWNIARVSLPVYFHAGQVTGTFLACKSDDGIPLSDRPLMSFPSLSRISQS